MRPINRTERPSVPEAVQTDALRVEVSWQPQNMEGRVVFGVADRVFRGDEFHHIENERRFAIRLDALRGKTFTRADGSTISGAQMEQDWQLILDALLAEGEASRAAVEQQQAAHAAAQTILQAKAEQLQRDDEALRVDAEALAQQQETERQALVQQQASEARPLQARAEQLQRRVAEHNANAQQTEQQLVAEQEQLERDLHDKARPA